MTKREFEYRNTVGLISCSLLLFCMAFLAFGLFTSFFPMLISWFPATTVDVIYQLLYAVLYAAVFLVPVLYFQKAHNRVRPPEELCLKFRMGRDTVLYLFVGLAVIHAAAMVNAEIIALFEPVTTSSQFEIFGQEASSNYQLILQFIAFAVVPPFVEELLFRGVILTNLLPFGKTQAVLASALLFGVMHQNFSQLLYATVAGLVFGYIYVQARSIWPCVLLHLTNNGLSVLQTALMERLPTDASLAVYTALQTAIYAAGVLCAILLILRGKREEPSASADVGAAGEVAAAPDAPSSASPVKQSAALSTEREEEISAPRRIRLFFTPTMIAFFIVSLVQAVLTLLTGLLL